MAKEIEKEQAYDPWKVKRQVYIPKMSRGEQDTQEVGLNNKTYFLPKNKWVEVPEPVAQVVDEMLRAREAMEKKAKADSGVREFTLHNA